ncbi:beta-fructofuranosidase [Orenia metallireducens]|jgi:beta-fructofuranosidase|uniref:Sucrose-6-phosphate hydrolase n=1 Tax=Orenia metallireducens TaxID=1413210 RepID=A0A285I799_9FIRM|nr:sucrose-6-phosphate hydrolase [Orenia metallireducens]PRX22370.1 beta-fructofuranosidase [Orenia metallireducens]SNY43885.1 beta-fructofuranosidase [Orenia metallireducens]
MNKEKEDKLLAKAKQIIEDNREKVAKGYYRLKYHLMAPVGWLNDPNGFIQFDGEYHLCYQFNPVYPADKLLYWGHYKSKDLVSWEELPVALAPSEWYETHGCYSGSAVDNDGTLTFIYTGNVKDEWDNRETYQCLAITEDGVNFQKLGPVIENQPEGYTRHFRDPKVWQKDGSWYMVIGTQTTKLEGRVLLYKSMDLKEWELVGEVAGSNFNNLDDFGYMWECPDLFELDGKDVLLTLPQGLEAQGYLYNNIYQAGYLVGKLNYKTGRMDHGEFRELDRGFDFYAAQTTLDDKGRRIMIAWMGLPEEDQNYAERDQGWIHCMTIPRELRLNAENRLIQNPVEELKQLRRDYLEYRGIEINNQKLELEGISGDVLELIVEFEVGDAEEFGIKLRCSADGKEETIIKYKTEDKILSFDRNKAGLGGGGVRHCLIENDGRLKLHFFIDKSSIEMFVNDGQEVFSARIYPGQDSKRIKFFAQGSKVLINKIQKWKLN